MIRQSSSQPSFSHIHHAHLDLDPETCPACGQDIPPEKLEEITGKIAAHEREKSRALTEKLEREHATERAQADARAQAQLEAERRNGLQREAQAREDSKREAEAAAAVTLAAHRAEDARAKQELTQQLEVANAAQKNAEKQRAESDRLLLASAETLKVEREQAQKREAAVREEERKSAKIESDKQVANIERNHKDVEQQLKRQIEAAHTQQRSSDEKAAQLETKVQNLAITHQKELEKNKEEAQQKIETARQEASAAAEDTYRQEIATHKQMATQATDKAQKAEEKIATLAREHQETLASELNAQREALEKDAESKLNAQSAKDFEERLKLTNKVNDLQRELEKKTAYELGEGAEVDVYEALRAEFPNDKISRIPKGTAGADVRHVVFENGKQCGVILYDSKNHKQYRSEHVAKLKSDQIAAKADHSILSTRKFPQGTGQLHVLDGVILVNPARVVSIATVVRLHLVQLHTVRSSEIERETKTEALYEFITSEQFNLLLGRVDDKAAALLKLQETEVTWHQTHWNKEGEALRAIQKAKADLCLSISTIIGIDNEAEETDEDIPW